MSTAPLQDHRFQSGDRVVLNKPLATIPVGSLGTVVRIYRSITNCYDVQFDAFRALHAIYGVDLDLVRAAGEGIVKK